MRSESLSTMSKWSRSEEGATEEEKEELHLDSSRLSWERMPQDFLPKATLKIRRRN